MKILTSLLLLLVSVQGFAQSNVISKAKSLIYTGYIHNNSQDWTAGIALLEKARQTYPNDQEIAYQLSLAYYGMIGACRSLATCEKLLEKIKTAQGFVKKLLTQNNTSSRYSALMGGLLAMEIEEKPAQMIFLGPRCSNYINKSIEYDKRNPIAWVEKGNLLYHSPMVFGGDTKKAIASFEKAIKLFEEFPNLKNENWQYLHAWVWLGLAYQDEGRVAEAKATFEQVLKLEPEFLWVKEVLIPGLKE